LADGSRSWRNNNPGNLEYGPFARAHGAIGTDGRYAIFPSVEVGTDAQRSKLFDSPAYRDLTLPQAIAKWAPRGENDVPGYLRAMGGDTSGRTMADYSPPEQDALLQSMRVHEGWRPGTGTPGTDDAAASTVAPLPPARPADLGAPPLPPARPPGLGVPVPLPPARPEGIGVPVPTPPARPTDIGTPVPLPPARPAGFGFGNISGQGSNIRALPGSMTAPPQLPPGAAMPVPGAPLVEDAIADPNYYGGRSGGRVYSSTSPTGSQGDVVDRPDPFPPVGQNMPIVRPGTIDPNLVKPTPPPFVPVGQPPVRQEVMNAPPPSQQDMLAAALAQGQGQPAPPVDPNMLALALQGGGAPDFGSVDGGSFG
jgi:hypothetical protein